MPGGVVIRAGEGETITDRPERTIRVLVEHELLTLSLFRYEPGEQGPDPHVHRRHTDAFYVLDGELELGLGPRVERVVAGPGTLAAAPPNVVHTFRNASGATTVFLNVHAPSMGFAEMLRAAHAGGDPDAAHFDQYDPPDGGGRPLAEAVLCAPGAASVDRPNVEFTLAEVELEPGAAYAAPPSADARLDVVYVLQETVRAEDLDAGPGDALIRSGMRPLRAAGAAPARLLHLSAPARRTP